MNSLQLQDQSIYKLLQPLFQSQGYELIPAKKQFRKRTGNGYRSVIFSISGKTDEQILDIHFGLRFDIIENLVQQFLDGTSQEEKDSNTVVVSLHRLKRPPLQQFIISDASGLHEACKEISEFMLDKGFRFLQTFDKLRKVDAKINRKPQAPSPYMHNQIQRCFKGIVIARLLQRNDFEMLTTIYRNYLYSQWAPAHIMDNYNRLVNYLKCFSFN